MAQRVDDTGARLSVRDTHADAVKADNVVGDFSCTLRR